MTPMPSYVRENLTANGVLNPHGQGRAAGAATCQHCKRTVIRGDDHHRVALLATCDPTPVDTEGELQALLAGRKTYALNWVGSRYELTRRLAINITSKPANARTADFDVLAEHKCGAPQIPAVATHLAIPQRPTLSDNPPF